MIYVYGCLDLIVKKEVFERQYKGFSKEVGKRERVGIFNYDADLMCFRLGMSSFDAGENAERLSKMYHFSLPDENDASFADSVITSPFGPTTKCNWIEEIGNGAYSMKKRVRDEWNQKSWLDKFHSASENADKKILHDSRVEVYEFTQKICALGKYLVNGNEICLDKPGESIVYDKEIKLPQTDDDAEKISIEVINEDCLKIAKDLRNENPLVLNMANRRTPGGGAKIGSGAQEECLFRSSNYFMSLYNAANKYPLDRNFGGVYTPDVTVFRDLESEGYGLLEEPFKTNFVAVAAINNPDLTSSGHLTREMIEGTKNKIRTILNIAVLNKHKVLILSALGCGAFHNPPEDIAGIFKEILREEPYYHFFRKVIFAIKKDHNDKGNGNYKAFEECFNGSL